MKKEELYKAIGEADDKFVSAAEKQAAEMKRRRLSIIPALAAAACFVLVAGVTAAVVIPKLSSRESAEPDVDIEIGILEQTNSAADKSIYGAKDSSASAENDYAAPKWSDQTEKSVPGEATDDADGAPAANESKSVKNSEEITSEQAADGFQYDQAGKVVSPDGTAYDPDDESAEPDVIASSAASYAYLSAYEVMEKSNIIFAGEYTGVTEEVYVDDKYREKYSSEVYTDYEFGGVTVINGPKSDTVYITKTGGTAKNGTVVSSSGPRFESGKRYLIFARSLPPRKDDDREHFSVITMHCFEIDENDRVNFEGLKPEDALILQNYYHELMENARETALSRQNAAGGN